MFEKKKKKDHREKRNARRSSAGQKRTLRKHYLFSDAWKVTVGEYGVTRCKIFAFSELPFSRDCIRRSVNASRRLWRTCEIMCELW